MPWAVPFNFIVILPAVVTTPRALSRIVRPPYIVIFGNTLLATVTV